MDEEISGDSFLFGDATNPNQLVDYCGDEAVCLEDRNEPDFFDPDDLPISAPSCWLLNRAYQQSLMDLKDLIQQKLEENRSQQQLIEAEEEQQNTPISTGYSHPNSLIKFMAPYFKDSKGLTPGDNEDVKLRKFRGDINICYMRIKKPWKDKDKQSLIKAVVTNCSKKVLEPLIKEEESILIQIKQYQSKKASEEQVDQLKTQLETIQQKINSIKTSDPASLVLPREKSDEIDWLEISSRMPSIYNPFACEIKWKNELHPWINLSGWSEAEDETLKSLVVEFPHDWEKIAENLSTNRVAWFCCNRYQSHLNESMRISGPFSKHEIDLITKVVESCRIGDYIPWHQVAYFIEGRSVSQIKLCWKKINMVKTGEKWTELEDQVLQAAVDKFGLSDWVRVAHFIPGRSNRQCRERYIMRLGVKDRKIADWTPNEDEQLIKMAPTLKFKWAEMINHILKRNPRQIAARYDLLERCRIEKILQSSKDLQELVPRKKPPRSRILTNPTASPVANYSSIDEFLCESRKVLELRLKNAKHKKRKLGANLGGRKKKPLEEAKVDEEITEMFATFDVFNKGKQPPKLIARPTEETILFEETEKALNSYLEKSIPEERHLLARVICSALSSYVVAFDSERLKYCPPILPPNATTTSSFQRLLLLNDLFKKNNPDTTLVDESLFFSTEYRRLMELMTSLYFWPCVMSSNQVTSKSVESVPKPQPVRGRKRKNSQRTSVIQFVNATRERQRALFSTARSFTEEEDQEES